MTYISVFLTLNLLALLLISGSPSVTPVNAPTPTETPVPGSFRIVAYVTEGIIESLIPYDRLTHINYSFLTPRAGGIMFWTLDFDAQGEFSLVGAIYETVHSPKIIFWKKP